MNAAQTNRPEGRAYTETFSEWLRLYKLDTIDKSARHKIFYVMAHRPAIETWRATHLTQLQRLELNHPVTVLRKWQKETKATKPKPLRPNYVGENEALAEQIRELEAARESAKPITLAAARELYLSHVTRLTLSEWKSELDALEEAYMVATNAIKTRAH
jgi:hypothetical protein